MATRRNPRFKECRRLGVNVCGHPKAMDRAGAPAFKKTKKASDYSLHLTEKQKVKAYYNILEKQLRRYFEQATKSKEMTGVALLVALETRLDNLVYRLGFASSIRMARQMVSHKHIEVDGKVINIPSYAVKVGSTISLVEKMRRSEQFKSTYLSNNKAKLDYLERDDDNFTGKLARLPLRSEIPVQINDQMVVEYYSK
ncbi:MAG: 30S ribosomal protein S4 [Treponema sp.]|uniref:30S ribosomal protein S4 n=1 Tax=Treponema sp. TaxID=166 RepID=UPI0025D8CFA5|nr:30S ribosomal protein S4 [Treponema sp.]MBQ9622818.1 30S ribosomal protein S4 [Treponema sp.]MBR0497088.1 30S ribosomal protein S4 [Treponema sp.]